MKGAAAAALAIFAVATASIATDTGPWAPPKVTSQYTPPSATGVPHLCLQDYPPLAVRLGVQGRTTIRFTIKEDGTVHDAAVTISSGSDLLDQATLDCASAWTYKPATQSGVAFAVPWKVRVEWYLHDTYEGPATDEIPPRGANWVGPIPRSGEDHGCGASLNFADHVGRITEPTSPTVVQFTITPEGRTRDFVVTHTSGSDAHDDVAVGCVTNWHYVPANHDGIPVGVRWSATIPWRETAQTPD